jgi:hypothetical protein
MQKADRRVELGLMNCPQTLAVIHQVTEQYQRVYLVLWRLVAASAHAEIVDD